MIGLILVGSAANEPHHPPDEWSDHDFIVVVEAGQQEDFRQHLNWLPNHEQMVINIRETEHGLKIVFADGHLVEFAIFDLDELNLMRVNTRRVVIDRADIGQRIERLRAATEEWKYTDPHLNDDHLVNQFLSLLLLGVSRYRRGEHLSGHHLVKTSALHHLLLLLEHHLPTDRADQIDNLDPRRRFEFAFPEVGVELNRILLLDVPISALAMLDLMERLVRGCLSNYPERAVDVIRQKITE